ncbi:MAG: glycosyltransferase family 4 protein [Betaproteobacteria bacterium]|nr:glycosyltransferase family 4 protein [Betaproteobacteria bacterium]
MRQVDLLALQKYGPLGASSRMRLLQYLPWLEQAGVRATVQPLLSNEQLQARYRQGGYGAGGLVRAYVRRLLAMRERRRFDVVWIEKEALPWMPLWLERGMLSGVPYVLDYDDAVFHNYDLHRSPFVRRIYGKRLDGLMAGAALVLGGNGYLAQRARDAGAAWVEVLPTVIDLERYPQPFDASEQRRMVASPETARQEELRIVWIGSPATAHYLQLLREPLQKLAARYTFTLRVIGGASVDLPGVRVEVLPWSEATEVAAISACDVGIMPLLDSPWERGKCGYKLVQYMACGLPCVASAVGANKEVLGQGEAGMLVNDAQGWLSALEALVTNPALRHQLGRAGRVRVESIYCLQKTAPLMADLLCKAAIS